MNEDDFEQRLRRQPMRQVPPAWRDQILSAADGAKTAGPAWHFGLSRLNAHLCALLWPSPKAWGGLAVVWLLVFVLNHSPAEKATLSASRKTPRPSLEMLSAWREQESLLAELLLPREPAVAQRPQPALPRPRSESRFGVPALAGQANANMTPFRTFNAPQPPIAPPPEGETPCEERSEHPMA
jgi:hypothetical protein